jgi:hypothetical protein
VRGRWRISRARPRGHLRVVLGGDEPEVHAAMAASGARPSSTGWVATRPPCRRAPASARTEYLTWSPSTTGGSSPARCGHVLCAVGEPQGPCCLDRLIRRNRSATRSDSSTRVGSGILLSRVRWLIENDAAPGDPPDIERDKGPFSSLAPSTAGSTYRKPPRRLPRRRLAADLHRSGGFSDRL